MSELEYYAKEINDACEGLYICPECGGKFTEDQYNEGEIEDGGHLCPHCYEMIGELCDCEEYSFYDYLNDSVLDIEYIVNQNKEYKGCNLTIAYGGPNVYINTIRSRLELYWGSTEELYHLSPEVVECIDRHLEDLYLN